VRDIDALVVPSGGTEAALKHVVKLTSAGRTFSDVAALSAAVAAAASSGLYVSDQQRNDLVGWLSTECNLFSDCVGDVRLTKTDVDEFVMLCNGVPSAQATLERLDKEGKKFSSLPEVMTHLRGN
jgi:hypothetical protein